jgi:hypothetical protein
MICSDATTWLVVQLFVTPRLVMGWPLIIRWTVGGLSACHHMIGRQIFEAPDDTLGLVVVILGVWHSIDSHSAWGPQSYARLSAV